MGWFRSFLDDLMVATCQPLQLAMAMSVVADVMLQQLKREREEEAINHRCGDD